MGWRLLSFEGFAGFVNVDAIDLRKKEDITAHANPMPQPISKKRSPPRSNTSPKRSLNSRYSLVLILK